MNNYRRWPRFNWYGWLGLAVLLLGQLGLFLSVSFVATWFTPIMWTGYILLGSGLFQRWTGRSWFSSARRELPFMALISVLVWLLFEAYNVHLMNWAYRGLPRAEIWRDVGYFWSFATIMPGVFITYKLLQLIWPSPAASRQDSGIRRSVGPGWLWFLVGLFSIILPLLLPTRIAAYLFAPIWLGFIFFLDPINEAMGMASLRLQWREGNMRTTWQWLAAGLLCGFIWEAWNFQALQAGGGHWVYTVPSALRITGLHFGQMPIEGLLGFPPFALELRAFYLWLWKLFGGNEKLGHSLIGN